MSKLRSDSFAAKLSPEQRDELYVALCGGVAYAAATSQVKAWSGRKPSEAALSTWFTRERITRTVALAREAGLVASAAAPADYTAQERAALGRARFLTLLKDLEPEQIAKLDRNDLHRQRLAIESRRLELDQMKVERLVLERFDDLVAARESAISRGLKGEDAVEAVRQHLWGTAAG